MPRVERISEEDIQWGLSSFTRTNRLDPLTTVSRTQVNAGHIPMSSASYSASTITGAFDEIVSSGPGVPNANRTAISGVILSNIADQIQGISPLWKLDCGNVGVSTRLLSHSTGLSSVITATATIKHLNSGLHFVGCDFSGHALDFWTRYTSGVGDFQNTLFSTSISWIAVGT